jgi:hypothetical protein
MIVPGRGCYVSTMVLGSVVGTGQWIRIFYALWSCGCNSGGNSSGLLMGPGTTHQAHVGPMRLACPNLCKQWLWSPAELTGTN